MNSFVNWIFMDLHAARNFHCMCLELPGAHSQELSGEYVSPGCRALQWLYWWGSQLWNRWFLVSPTKIPSYLPITQSSLKCLHCTQAHNFPCLAAHWQHFFMLPAQAKPRKWLFSKILILTRRGVHLGD